MYRKIFVVSTLLLSSIILLIGCTDTLEYNNEDVAAIVRGEEITIGDLRFLYSDDEILEKVEGTVKARLVVQEAKKMKLDISDEMKSVKEAELDYLLDSPNVELVESQAQKFGMEPEKYYQELVELNTETGAYINAYVQNKLGKPTVEQAKEYDKQANQLLDDLVEENKDEIDILIK